MKSEKVSDSDRSTLLSFLSGGVVQGHPPHSGEIFGILKQLKDEMSADLTDAGKAKVGKSCGTRHGEEGRDCQLNSDQTDPTR